MAETKKITKKEVFTEMVGIFAELGREDLVEFTKHQIELLDNKKSSKTQTKNQVENEVFKGVILEVLASQTEPLTIDGIRGLDEDLGALSNQRVSAIVRQLVDSKQVVRTQEGRKALFTIAD